MGQMGDCYGAGGFPPAQAYPHHCARKQFGPEEATHQKALLEAQLRTSEAQLACLRAEKEAAELRARLAESRAPAAARVAADHAAAPTAAAAAANAELIARLRAEKDAAEARALAAELRAQLAEVRPTPAKPPRSPSSVRVKREAPAAPAAASASTRTTRTGDDSGDGFDGDGSDDDSLGEESDGDWPKYLLGADLVNAPHGKSMKPLSSAASAALSTKLEPEQIVQWLKLAKHRLAGHDKRIRNLLRLTPSQSAAFMLRVQNDDALCDIELGMLEADEFMPLAIFDCLDPSSTHVHNFRTEVTADTLQSGIALISKIAELPQLKLACERQDADKRFASAQPFYVGMPIAEAKKTALETIDLFKRTTRFNPYDSISVRHMLIQKMPTSNERLVRKKEQLEEELLECEITLDGTGTDNKPWSVDQLIKIIALALRADAPARAHGGVHGGGGGAGGGGGGAGGGGGGPSRRVCLACGDPGHETTDCPKQCPNATVRVRGCPCLHGKVCPFLSAKMIKAGTLVNAKGDKMPSGPEARIVDAHKKQFPRAYQLSRSAHAANAEAKANAAASADAAAPSAAPAPAPSASAALPGSHAAIIAGAVAGDEAPRLHAHASGAVRSRLRRLSLGSSNAIASASALSAPVADDDVAPPCFAPHPDQTGLADGVVYDQGGLCVIDDDAVPNQLHNPALASAPSADVATALPDVSPGVQPFAPLMMLGALTLEDYEAQFPCLSASAPCTKGRGRPGKKARARAAARARRSTTHGTVHDTTGRHPAVHSAGNAGRPPRRERVRLAKARERAAAADACQMAEHAAAGHRMRGVISRLDAHAVTSFARRQIA